MKGTTLKIEPELTAQAAALFAELGMDLSTATGIFYRQHFCGCRQSDQQCQI